MDIDVGKFENELNRSAKKRLNMASGFEGREATAQTAAAYVAMDIADALAAAAATKPDTQ